MKEPGYRLDLEHIGFDLSKDIEAARILVSSEEETTVIVNPHAVDEAFALGVVCVDFMKHGAQAKGVDPNEAFQAILRGVMAELQDPSGEMLD